MATYIDVITGFLESGKTTVIKDLLKSNLIEELNKILLVICEEGFTEYDEEKLKKMHIETLFLEDESDLNDDLFKQIADEYNPDYIIVEYNGTWDITKILRLKIPFNYKFRNVAFVSDAGNFMNQLSNMVTVMQPHILNCDIVIFNRFENLQRSMQKKLVSDVKNINPKTKVTFLNEFETDKILTKCFTSFYNPGNVFLNFKTLLKVDIFFVLCFSLFLIFETFNAYSYIQSVAIVFLSILMQAIPFILLGAFISAGIQIFASTGWIMKQISKGRWYSFLIAAVAGFFMPICDCGMVPIISGLLKKDTPLPQTITFWLSSSAVSPIVIVSMLYAFPEHPYLAVVRVVTGLIIGIMTGIILKLVNIKTENVTKGNRRVQNIGKDILELKYDGIKGRIEAIFAGAKIEFFRVAEYVIVGALISAI
ncbi:MAG: permease, partial [Bacteroidaceae bacterium]|nr:permease [Bacteroidaceae bacterium]